MNLDIQKADCTGELNNSISLDGLGQMQPFFLFILRYICIYKYISDMINIPYFSQWFLHFYEKKKEAILWFFLSVGFWRLTPTDMLEQIYNGVKQLKENQVSCLVYLSYLIKKRLILDHITFCITITSWPYLSRFVSRSHVLIVIIRAVIWYLMSSCVIIIVFIFYNIAANSQIITSKLNHSSNNKQIQSRPQ